MTRNLTVILALFFIAQTSCKQTEEPVEQPNILFIMTDDHSFQTISAYSDKLIETPNLDRIADEGVIFTNGFVGNSICAPSRATLLTGKHTHVNGQINNRVTFDGSQVTFPKLLQQAGYQTAMIGKWHLKSDPTGFDYWNILPGQGEYYNPDFIEMGEKKQVEGYCTTLTTDFALDWLDGRDSEKPFCLLLHHKAPHRTWQPDTIHFDEFRGKTYPVPDNFFDDYEGRTAAAEQKLSIRENDMDIRYDLKMQDERIESRFPGMDHTARMNEKQKKAWEAHYNPIREDYLERNLQGKELDIWKYQRYMQDYLACIRSVDENVGRVLDYLEENGLDENTLVVYTSDQGFYMGEHGWFDKRFMYEESLRTPLLMRLPRGYSAKGEVTEMVQNIDYAPTFLDFAGVEIPSEIQGKSMKPLLANEENVEWRDGIYYHYYEFPNEHMVKRHYGIRTDRYKLIHFYYDIDEWEFYDLATDPDEMNNLIDSQEHAALIDSLKTELVKLQEKYNDNDTDRSTY
ncbi:Arylsulfatase A [Tangfeifania diversioriginum]|uniref:Arylsulfatase A n=1 Tax=Tangfeifania diversioriginum TaxID=1168035 RepID=A0A1M6H3E3_9BACT|nr:sulfatase [Tangfeifania diversioriginum]SHJ16704.1 Arylsulfatase A [Tangfeifania diversioriginum]